MATEQLNEAPVATDVLPGNLSSIFRRHREAQELNINQVAEALCLSPKVITAIEAENLDELPEPPYVRGYLRSFAKYTEVDPTEMINAYEKLRGAEPHELDYHFNTPPATKSNKSGMNSGMLKLSLLIIFIGMLVILSLIPSIRDWVGNTWNQFSDQSEPSFLLDSDNTNPLLTGNIPSPLPITEESNPESTTDASIVKTNTNNAGFPDVGNGPISENTLVPTNTSNTSNLDATADNLTPEADASKEAVDTATEATEGTSVINLTFNEDVWMRIRGDNNKKLFEALSKKGENKELTLPRPMVVRVGNAQALEITIDGKPFDMTPHIDGSIANFTLE